jgi:hypothetical protein
MPGFDRTGPRGMGPMTGGGRGFCSPWGMGAPYGRGRGMPYGYSRGQPRYGGAVSPSDTGDSLIEQLHSLTSRLEELTERIDTLERKK